MISSQPGGEIVELFAVGQYGGQAYDPPLRRIGPAEQPLYLDFVADLPFGEADQCPSSKTS